MDRPQKTMACPTRQRSRNQTRNKRRHKCRRGTPRACATTKFSRAANNLMWCSGTDDRCVSSVLVAFSVVHRNGQATKDDGLSHTAAEPQPNSEQAPTQVSTRHAESVRHHE